ncbi:hypothetical protein B0T16DRAFT_399650 [Cercophora newfieldiana]|uniref:Uncharacterized protein n=1 Tax=Cercophora newfieldiana TaxID=92897 RepID=A0AA39YPY2_9PEZI|nr:hypothetical protein B0T16DRAFT_399650 [Cercophora newfieldiana]
MEGMFWFLISFHVSKGAVLSFQVASLGSTAEIMGAVKRKMRRGTLRAVEFWVEVDTQIYPDAIRLCLVEIFICPWGLFATLMLRDAQCRVVSIKHQMAPQKHHGWLQRMLVKSAKGVTLAAQMKYPQFHAELHFHWFLIHFLLRPFAPS